MVVTVDIYIRNKQPLIPASNAPGYNTPIQRYPFSPLTSFYRSHVLQTSDRAMQRINHPSSVIRLLHSLSAIRKPTSPERDGTVRYIPHLSVLHRGNSLSHSLTHGIGTEVIPIHLLQILKSHVFGYDTAGSVAEERA